MEPQESAVGATVIVGATMEGRIIRCGCGDPLNIHGYDEFGALRPCPTPRDTSEVLHGVSIDGGE